jgi:ribosomal protein S18 acetylase RimI-like enzyme
MFTTNTYLLTMSCSKFVSSLSGNANGGPRTNLSVVSLKEFIAFYSHELSEYYGEDFGNPDIKSDQVGDTLIICLVDFGYWRNTSPTTTKTLRKAGRDRRMKIKHRYSYDNPMNRIHGFLIGEEVRNSLIPEENKILSLSLICASVFSDKKGVGSDLMDHFLHLSKEAGYTDVILEVSNEWAGTEADSEEEESDEESDEESNEETDEESDSDEEEDSWVPSEEVIDIISHEFWRKTMRKPDGDTPFYNVAKDYISGHVADYLYAAEGDVEEAEPQYVSDEDDPKDHEYGGFWYRKGRSSQIGLIKFYEKFGFVEEPEIHLGWHCYGNIPLPSMICSL